MIQCLDCGMPFDNMPEFLAHEKCRKIGYKEVEVETWRVYPHDTGFMKFKSGKFLVIRMSDDGTHALVQFTRD